MRNKAVDLARCVAAFGVIVIHCGPTTPAAGKIVDFFLNFSVPFFLLTSLYYFWEEVGRPSDPARALRRRLPRLLVPYLAWTVIYVAARCLKLLWLGRWPRELFSPPSLVEIVGSGAGAVQLYFLPLLALALGLAWLLAVALARIGPWRPWVLVGLVIGGAITLLSDRDALTVKAASPLLQLDVRYMNWAVWMLPIAAASALLAKGRDASPRRPLRSATGWILIALAVAIDLAIVFGRLPYSWRFHSLVLAMLVLEGCRRLDLGPPAARRLAALLPASFGIYLVHHLLIELIEMIDRRPVGALTQPFTAGTLLLVSAAVFAASAAFTLTVIKHPLLARILLGARAERP